MSTSFVNISLPSSVLEINVLVLGRPVQKYFHDNKVYIEARKGSEYTIQLVNKGYKRLLANVTVDGLSVMDGKEGDLTKQTGYVVGAWSTVTIPGWRLDNNSVAAFKFGESGGSYAAKIGKPRNVGVIGVAVFEEKQTPVDYFYNQNLTWTGSLGGELYGSHYTVGGHYTGDVFPYVTVTNSTSCNVANDAGSATSAAEYSANSVDSDSVLRDLDNLDYEPVKSNKSGGGARLRSGGDDRVLRSRSRKSVEMTPDKVAGTEFGAKISSVVEEITFVPSTETPMLVATMQYKFSAELEKMGIELHPPTVVVRNQEPSAFPVNDSGCTPPPGWSTK